jgi:UDPglucose--hexose-1-phosphate uridylyltransferase
MLLKKAHRRLNPLTNEWVLVCANRTQRPWQGANETITADTRPTYDPNCYLCPGNTRANGEKNPNYQDVYVFNNDFSALKREENLREEVSALFSAEEVSGECRVICFSPEHNLTLPQMSVEAIEKVIVTWKTQFIELSQNYAWVQLFENKGAAMGCSNPHPHGQIWASNFLPNEIQQEELNQHCYFREHQSRLLYDYAQAELAEEIRIIEQNEHWVVVVPYWATWPFETLLLPKAQLANWQQMTAEQAIALAEILKSFLARYDRLFNISFPYSMGWHCAPAIKGAVTHWQLHAHFYPPLLRSATVKKFMVGYEMLAEAQRDITPEAAAEKLREV